MKRLDDYQQEFRDRLAAMPEEAPPPPWRPVDTVPIGGFTDGGYLPGSDTFLAISSMGRGLFDALTGEKIGRDRESHGDWMDHIQLTAQSIAPQAGIEVRIGGLSGGGLPLHTRDGWHLELTAPCWPYIAVFLEPPGVSVILEERAAGARKFFEDCEPHVVGFSPTGRSFVIGTSSELIFFTR